MKHFVLTVKCAGVQDLITAIDHARACILEDPDRYDEMPVDDLDEMLGDTGVLEVEFSRSE